MYGLDIRLRLEQYSYLITGEDFEVPMGMSSFRMTLTFRSGRAPVTYLIGYHHGTILTLTGEVAGKDFVSEKNIFPDDWQNKMLGVE